MRSTPSAVDRHVVVDVVHTFVRGSRKNGTEIGARVTSFSDLFVGAPLFSPAVGWAPQSCSAFRSHRCFSTGVVWARGALVQLQSGNVGHGNGR